jgi:hypothetical protein
LGRLENGISRYTDICKLCYNDREEGTADDTRGLLTGEEVRSTEMESQMEGEQVSEMESG